MSKENIPDFMLQFWRDSPTSYTRDNIFHMEPLSENAVFLKYLALLNGGDSENSDDSGSSGGDQVRGFITSVGEDFITSDNLIFMTKG